LANRTLPKGSDTPQPQRKRGLRVRDDYHSAMKRVGSARNASTISTSSASLPIPASACPPGPPPIQCQKCLCDPGSELFESCNCSADPRGVGCELVPREPDCDVDNRGDECPCTSI